MLRNKIWNGGESLDWNELSTSVNKLAARNSTRNISKNQNYIKSD